MKQSTSGNHQTQNKYFNKSETASRNNLLLFYTNYIKLDWKTHYPTQGSSQQLPESACVRSSGMPSSSQSCILSARVNRAHSVALRPWQNQTGQRRGCGQGSIPAVPQWLWLPTRDLQHMVRDHVKKHTFLFLVKGTMSKTTKHILFLHFMSICFIWSKVSEQFCPGFVYKFSEHN